MIEAAWRSNPNNRAVIITAAKNAASWWGSFGRSGDIDSSPRKGRKPGLYVRRGNREGVIPWGEVVDALRPLEEATVAARIEALG